MDWNELRTFIAVAETASFSRASEQLFITQPAVSRRIQALEQHFGTRLFDRAGKRVFLTPHGELLLPRARHLMREMEDTETLMHNVEHRVAGVLNLATSHHIGLHRLAPVLQQYAKTYPDVALNIRFVDSEVAHSMVRKAEVDLAVVTLDSTPDSTSDTQLERQVLWVDPLCFVVGESHALHQLTETEEIPLSRLLRFPAVLPGLSTFTGRIAADAFSAAGLTLNPGMSTNYLETIAMLVSIGLGWSVLPHSMLDAPQTEASRRIRALKVATTPLIRHLGMVANPRRTRSNAALAFSQTLKDFRDSDLAF